MLKGEFEGQAYLGVSCSCVDIFSMLGMKTGSFMFE